MSDAAAFFEQSYRESGVSAQRQYPNEELCRFLARRFPDKAARRGLSVLEVGCGSGANLWMIAREGFKTYGLDFDQSAIELAERLLQSYGVSASLRTGDMRNLPYPDNSFDCVCDVFSSYCLPKEDFPKFLGEARRITKAGGSFFCFTPSKQADVFKTEEKLDEDTLNGIRRKGAPYAGNHYPFRFTSPEDISTTLSANGFSIGSIERIGRTYRNREEYFEMLSITATVV